MSTTAKKPSKSPRKQMWVDANVQGAIIQKVIFYWAACVVFVTIPLLWAAIAEDPSKYVYQHMGPVAQRYWPLYGSMLLLLPFTIWDALQLSHRIAGPVMRVRQQLGKINNGEPFAELKFRANDFWHDLAEQVNLLSKKTLS